MAALGSSPDGWLGVARWRRGVLCAAQAEAAVNRDLAAASTLCRRAGSDCSTRLGVLAPHASRFTPLLDGRCYYSPSRPHAHSSVGVGIELGGLVARRACRGEVAGHDGGERRARGASRHEQGTCTYVGCARSCADNTAWQHGCSQGGGKDTHLWGTVRVETKTAKGLRWVGGSSDKPVPCESVGSDGQTSTQRGDRVSKYAVGCNGEDAPVARGRERQPKQRIT